MISFKQDSRWVSVLYSVLAHAALVVGAMFIQFVEPFEAPAEELMHFNVKSADSRPLLLKHTSPATNPDAKNPSRRFRKPIGEGQSLKDVAMTTLLKPTAALPEKEAEITPKRLEIEEGSDDRKPEIDAYLAKTDENYVADVIQIQQKSTSGAAETAKMLEGHKADLKSVVSSLSTAVKKIGLGGSGSVDLDPEEGMPGFTPIEGQMGNSTYDQGGGTRESKGDILRYESLDDFLDIQIFNYEDPFDKQKYYMIKIYAKKEAKALKVMPKEILFAIDCSLSISPERLDEFKRGISYCLSNLNKDDLFNIIAFRDQALFFAPRSVKATPDLIKKAERFVSELTSNRTTDMYGAFEKIVQIPLERNPSNIILISDGRPTNGIVNSRELINSISRLNKNARPIFAYSGGSKVNRYLLDFISYQNRAWSQFIKDRGKIHKGLGDFYAKIKDPVFLNLRYQLNGLTAEEVFPKTLPDFYKNAEFTLYGKYSTEDKFSMQLLGDIEGQTKELIFSRSLKDAVKGGPEIMKGYAFNKIYHLISQVTSSGQNAQSLKQIQELSTRYKVTTPYSADLESND